MARCTGTSSDGGSVTIDAVVGMIPFPAVATEGTLRINGNPKIVGACGGVQANVNRWINQFQAEGRTQEPWTWVRTHGKLADDQPDGDDPSGGGYLEHAGLLLR